MKTLAALLVLSTVALSADAGGCATVVRSYSYAAPAVTYTYAAQAVYSAPVYQAAPVYAPSYSVGYQADAAAAELAKLRTELKLSQIQETLQRLELQQLKAQQPAPLPPPEPIPEEVAPPQFQPKAPKAPGPVSKAHPGLSVLRASCASCHEAKTAAAKGGGFVLLKGASLASLSQDQADAVMEQLLKRTMPPQKKLAEAARVNAITFIATVQTTQTTASR